MKVIKSNLRRFLSGAIIIIFLNAVVKLFGQEASTNNIVEPMTIARLALAHSLKLKSLGREYIAIEALGQQARAQGLPQVGVDARSTHYTGLTESQLGPFYTIPTIENRYSAGITISQPLYTGGRIKSLKESAVLGKKAVAMEKEASGAEVALNAVSAYWNWSKAYYWVDSLKVAVERMEAHSKDVHNLNKVGMATDNEVFSSDVLLDKTRLQYESAKRALDVAIAQIEYLIGTNLSRVYAPKKPESLKIGDVPSAGELIQIALQNRLERAARIYEVQSAERKIATSQADYYPQVSLVARYEQARPNILNIPPIDKWQDDAFAGVTISWNIFDWGLRAAKVKEALARRDQARLRLEMTEEQIALEVKRARIGVIDALERVAVSERIEESARRNLKSATDLWRNGMARHSDVLDAHAQLTDAQYLTISARADLEVARWALEYAIGKLNALVFGQTGKDSIMK